MFKDRRTAMLGTLVLALFLSSLILTNPGKALAVSFLKITGVDGESTDNKYKNQIDVISWSFGDSQTAVSGAAAGARTAGRVKMQDLKITMRTNKASPKLFLYCANGQRINNVELSVCKSDASRQKFLNIKLSDVIVSSFVSLSGTGSTDYPMEEIMFNFGKIEITYTPIDPKTGTSGAPITTSYDMTTSKAQ